MASSSSVLFPASFAGSWDCETRLTASGTGPGGEQALAAHTAVSEGFSRCRAAQGSPAGVRKLQCDWESVPTGFAKEKPGGACVGPIAAAVALAGPTFELKGHVIPQAGAEEGVWWELSGSAQQLMLRPAGAVGKQNPGSEGAESFQVHELFEVERLAHGVQTQPLTALIRVTTEYRQGRNQETGVLQMQALQTATVMAPPEVPNQPKPGDNLAGYQYVLLFSPAKASSR
eukprot:TRINITY_DN47657_c0_g1_i1.p2 TRINITY_DN47657_c0_g1~~TRINITY_DN47657_c0_g1_i1.p2  ORF type:complete len:230 (-),score=47.36 TRINITY_DN47657_c0_g1_i1:88-777(-)